MVDILGFGAIIAVCAGMLYLSSRIEPHWVSKDGRRFLTVAQELDQWGTPLGRRREIRVRFEPDEPVLLISRRSMRRPTGGHWQVVARAPNPPRGRAIFLLKRLDGGAARSISRSRPRLSDTATRGLGMNQERPIAEANQMALRLPVKSKMVAELDKMVGAPASAQNDLDDTDIDE